MGDFSADWLSLRESADAAARSASITSALAEQVGGRRVVRVLDLATGTGANVRYLAPQLTSPQEWLVVDRDSDLLAHLPRRVSSWGLTRGCIVAGDSAGFVLRADGFECRVESRCRDLSRLDDPSIFRDRDLVTASALLDLVSDRWLQTLVQQCAAVRVPVLFALTYDGRMKCAPDDPDDGLVCDLVNRHQRRAKGFGRALGPDAADAAIGHLQNAGYECRREMSDWRLTGGQAALQHQLVEGWAAAAGEIARKDGDRVARWKERRMALIEEGRSEVMVGHADIAAWPVTG